MRVLKNKRENQNYKKLRVIGLFCFTWIFRCNTGVFPQMSQALYAWECCNHGMSSAR